ncbi:hypothetical protein ACE6H2_026261 [Prunus campanulata]
MPSYLPNPLQTNSFHEYWCARMDSWFPESAKFFHSYVFNECPCTQSMTECEELSLFCVLNNISNIYLTALPKVFNKGESSSVQVSTSQSSSGLVLGRSIVFSIIEEEVLEQEEAFLIKKRRRSSTSHSAPDLTLMN